MATDIRKDLSDPQAYFRAAANEAHQRRLTQALDILIEAVHRFPDSAECRLRLAEYLEKDGRFEEAKSSFRIALKIDPTSEATRAKLAAALLRAGEFVEARTLLSDCSAARQPYPKHLVCLYVEHLLKARKYSDAASMLTILLKEHVEDSLLWQLLAGIYRKVRHRASALYAFERSIELNPLKPHGQYRAFGGIAVALGRARHWTDLIPKAILRENPVFAEIWHLLNSPNPSLSELTAVGPDSEPDLTALMLFFSKSTALTIVDSMNMTAEDEALFESVGIHLSHLLKNRDFILDDSNRPQHVGPHPYAIDCADKIGEARRRSHSFSTFQRLAVREGFMRAVCPFSGAMLSSDRSFLVRRSVFYRFALKEVFYLVCFAGSFEKDLLFFPGRDLLVRLSWSLPWDLNLFDDIVAFKALASLYAKDVVRYLEAAKAAKKGVLVAGVLGPGHHALNALPALYSLEQDGLLQELDFFYIRTAEYFAPVEDLFPDIKADLVRRRFNDRIFCETLKENCFTVAIGASFMPDALLNRISNLARSRCRKEILQQIEEVKRRHFPIVWINVRNHNRRWVSQVEGYSNMITALKEEYPRLAVVVDGFSRWRQADGSVSAAEDHFVASEKNLVQKIRSLLPPAFPLYDIVGALMDESITWAHSVDCFAVYCGTAQLKPQVLAEKPGVCFGASSYMSSHFAWLHWPWVTRENGYLVEVINCRPIIETNGVDSWERMTMDWQTLHQALRKVLTSLPRRELKS